MPKPPCSQEGCDRPVVAKGLCASHYYTKRNSEARAAIRSVDRPCQVCGGSLAGKRPNAMYCSDKCKYDAQDADRRADVERRRKDRICEFCGGPIAESRSTKARTCSDECSVALQNRLKQDAINLRKASRPPCERCGGPVPVTRRNGAAFCSDKCAKLTHGDRWREQSPHYMRLYNYNLSAAEYEAMLAKQESRCAICGTRDWAGKHGVPHVDHCHETNKVRGLLCDSCNSGLGRFKDRPEVLELAAAYLRRHQ